MSKKVSLAILLSGLLLWNCSEGTAEEPASTQARTTVPVKTTLLKLDSFSDYIEVTGTVHARNHVNIVVEEAGTLRRILRDKGRSAGRGDTLAILEDKVLEATYRQARANLNQAKLTFESNKVLYAQKAISENEFRNSEYAIEGARAAYDLARARYGKLFITAPIGGLVNNRYYDLGAYATPGTQIFELLDKSYVKIRAGVAERYLGDIRVGTPVNITFDAFRDLNIDGRVTFRSGSIDPANRTFEIEVEIPNPDGKLAPQMIANVKVLRESYPQSISVPLDALVESENGWSVFVNRGGVARKVNVRQVAVYKNNVLVDGVGQNEELVVVGQQELSDGDSLQVVQN